MIAVIANREGVDCPSLLYRAAADCRAAGLAVAGILAENGEAEGPCSAAYVRDIASGRRYSIHLDTPPAGKTCHLDAEGMEDACAGVLGQIASADVVVLSKFGKLEATGQGLWPAFTAAVAADRPLLTTVSARHRQAWERFAPAATWLDADAPSIRRWWQAAAPQARPHPAA